MATLARNDQVIGAHSILALSRTRLWAGRTISGVIVLLLLADAAGKLLQVQAVVEGTRQLGYPADTVFGLGLTLLACVIAYAVPRTSALGALLLTAYLGGAVATHVRVGNPLFSHVLAPAYVAAFVWAGLLLRDPRLQALLPVGSES